MENGAEFSLFPFLFIVVLQLYPYNAQNEPNNATRGQFSPFNLVHPFYQSNG